MPTRHQHSEGASRGTEVEDAHQRADVTHTFLFFLPLKPSSSQKGVFPLVPTVECLSFILWNDVCAVRHERAVFSFITQSVPLCSVKICFCDITKSWKPILENGLDSEVGGLLCPTIKLLKLKMFSTVRNRLFTQG